MTKIHLTATILSPQSGTRLDQALAQLFSQYSRSQLSQWIKLGKVSLDGKIQFVPRTKVHAEQTVEILAETVSQLIWQAEEIPLDIVYHDDTIIIVNKPPGLVVHPGAGNPDHTLVNALLHFEPRLDKLPRAGIVHRLDKDTSGLLVIARTLSAHNYLVKEMEQRTIKREYEAIVCGVMIAGGTISAPIGRHPHMRVKMSVRDSGKEAITHYRVIEKFRAHTHIRLQLESGRTHQIRVHLAHIHYPIVGDPLYGKQKILATSTPQLQTVLKNFKRQALHAAQLTLLHPITKKEIIFKATLPNDMQALIHTLKEDKKS